MNSDEELIELLKSTRPKMMHRGDSLDARHELLLDSITGHSTSRHVLEIRPAFQVASGFLMAAALVFLVVIGAGLQIFGATPSGAYAVTPAPLNVKQINGDVDMVLRKLSESVSGLPAQRVQFQSWALAFDPETRSAPKYIQPEETTIEEEHDGAVVLKTTFVGSFDSNGEKVHVKGSPEPGTVVMKQRFASGEFPYLFPKPKAMPEWSTYLSEGFGLTAETTSGDYFIAIRALLSERALSPEQQSSLIRFVATIPGVQVDGKVTDRLGRQGISVSVKTRSGGDYQDVLVISEGMGIVAYESVYVGSGRTDVHAPAVMDYTAWK